MGYDNTGILFYGVLLPYGAVFRWNDPDAPDDQWFDDWEQYWLAQQGFDPEPECTDWRNDEVREQHYQEVYRPWKQRRDELIASLGCRIHMYNSCHDPCWFVAHNEAYHEGGCKPPLVLDPTALRVPALADDQLRRFCEQLGLPFEQPRWYLTGLYS